MSVPDAIYKRCFDYGILKLIDHKEVDQTLVFATVASSCKVKWDALSSYNWFAHEHKTRDEEAILGGWFGADDSQVV